MSELNRRPSNVKEKTKGMLLAIQWKTYIVPFIPKTARHERSSLLQRMLVLFVNLSFLSDIVIYRVQREVHYYLSASKYGSTISLMQPERYIKCCLSLCKVMLLDY